MPPTLQKQKMRAQKPKVKASSKKPKAKSPQTKAQSKKPKAKGPQSSFSDSFISRGKQGRAAVLGEGRGIVTGETFVPTSLNMNNLGESAVLHSSSVAGAVPISSYR
jgi:hypothetical protein